MDFEPKEESQGSSRDAALRSLAQEMLAMLKTSKQPQPEMPEETE